MELLAIWQGGLSRVCFALSEMGVEGAGGGGLYRRALVFGCGVVVIEYVLRGNRCDGGEGGLVPAMMAAVGALQRGGVGGGSAHGGGHACGGHG